MFVSLFFLTSMGIIIRSALKVQHLFLKKAFVEVTKNNYMNLNDFIFQMFEGLLDHKQIDNQDVNCIEDCTDLHTWLDDGTHDPLEPWGCNSSHSAQKVWCNIGPYL